MVSCTDGAHYGRGWLDIVCCHREVDLAFELQRTVFSYQAVNFEFFSNGSAVDGQISFRPDNVSAAVHAWFY